MTMCISSKVRIPSSCISRQCCKSPLLILPAVVLFTVKDLDDRFVKQLVLIFCHPCPRCLGCSYIDVGWLNQLFKRSSGLLLMHNFLPISYGVSDVAS